MNIIKISSKIIAQPILTNRLFKRFSTWPNFTKDPVKDLKEKITVLHSNEIKQYIPDHKQEEFKKQNKIVTQKNNLDEIYVSEKIITKLQQNLTLPISLKKNCSVQFTSEIQNIPNFQGFASEILSTAYSFSRKQKQKDKVQIQLSQFKQSEYVLELTNAKLRSKEWANMRGDQANPEMFLKQALRIFQIGKQKFGDKIKIQTIKGNDLLKQGFRLMHAVGRASENQSIFINLSYKGNPDSDQFHSFVGKGVCFDAGGLNLKPTTGIKQMHMDKHGATSVLSAFQSVLALGLKINLTVSMGFVQNFLSNNSYRPLDIIKSRKGLTVEIGNTDAEGRLVLADCMNWTQQKFKVIDLIELSTLTGAIIMALGKKHAGLFCNNNQLADKLVKAGEAMNQKLWRMPVDSYHHNIIKPKTADLTNSAGKPDAASSQAAAFLQNFVQNGVKWAHIDIAGTSNNNSDATGYGARLLINYLKNQV